MFFEEKKEAKCGHTFLVTKTYYWNLQTTNGHKKVTRSILTVNRLNRLASLIYWKKERKRKKKRAYFINFTNLIHFCKKKKYRTYLEF